MSQSVSTLPNRAAYKSLKDCGNLGEALQTKEFFEKVAKSVPKHIQPDRMLRTFLHATTKEMMQCNMRSVLGAMLTCSQLGLEPNTPLQHAFLIPFKGSRKEGGKWVEIYNLNLILGYPGLLELSYRNPKFKSVTAKVVFEDEAKDPKHFSFSFGTDAHLRHVPTSGHGEDEIPVFAYAFAQLEGGQMFEVMPWADIERIRDNSQGYRAALKAREYAEKDGKNLPKTWTEAPWVKHLRPMAAKTAFRGLSKWLPRSIELAAAVAMDERQDHESLDFSPVLDGAIVTDNELPGAENEDVPVRGDAAFGSRTRQDEQQGGQQQGQGGDRSKGGLRVVDKMPEDHPADETMEQATARAEREEKIALGQVIPSTAREERIARESKEGHKERGLPWPVPTQGGSRTEFQGWLADENGEAVSMEPIEDAVQFARELEKMWQNSPNREALIANNRDSMDEAAANSEEAARIIGTIDGSQSGGGQTSALVAVQVPEGRGGWDVYVKAISEALQQGVPADRLNEWAELQRAGIMRAANPIRLRMARIIADYAKYCQIEPPKLVIDALQTGKDRTATRASGEVRQPQPAPAEQSPPSQGKQEPNDLLAATMNRLNDDDGKAVEAGQPGPVGSEPSKDLHWLLETLDSTDVPDLDTMLDYPRTRASVGRLSNQEKAIWERAVETKRNNG